MDDPTYPVVINWDHVIKVYQWDDIVKIKTTDGHVFHVETGPTLGETVADLKQGAVLWVLPFVSAARLP